MNLSTAISRTRNLHGIHFPSLLSDEEHVELFDECTMELKSRYKNLPIWEYETELTTVPGSPVVKVPFFDASGVAIPAEFGKLLDVRVAGDQDNPRYLTAVSDDDFDLLDTKAKGLPKLFKYSVDPQTSLINFAVWPTPDTEEVITFKVTRAAAGMFGDPAAALSSDGAMPVPGFEWLWVYSAAIDVIINRNVNVEKLGGLYAKKSQKQLALLDRFAGSSSSRPMHTRRWR